MRLLLSRGWWMVLLVWGAAAELLRGDPSQDATDRLAALIQQLGDSTFARREEAGKELAALGEPALPALRQAVATSEEGEIRWRAQQVIRTIMLNARHSKSIGLEMALIDAGEFQMGSPAGERGRRADELQHRVTITRPFLLGAYEVTQGQYEQVMKTNPSWFANTGEGKVKVAGQDTSRFPVENVTWYDAIEFCNLLSRQDGYEPYYTLIDVRREANSVVAAKVTIAGGNGYRLPTEAEWEYACRAGTITAFFYGTSNTGREANLKPGPAIGYGAAPNWPTLERTAKVGSYAPNIWGLYDMHGNAGEWCWDWYDKDYGPNPTDDPHGPDKGDHRVIRGGSWLVNEGSCRSASRFFLTPGDRNYYTGFRVARTP